MTDAREYLRTHPWITFNHFMERAGTLHWLLLGEATALCSQIADTILPPSAARNLNRVYLIKGVKATTAIEGNTLSEKQIEAQIDGRLWVPPSQDYLKKEVRNALNTISSVVATIKSGERQVLTANWIAEANRCLLADLDNHLADGVVPGEISTFPVVVSRYLGAPRQDCNFLLNRLCEWLDGNDWPSHVGQDEERFMFAILKAIYAHLYLAWIHPFGDGNGRTARLAEFMILVRDGIPLPCAHILSNHYNQTRSEYYWQLDRSSRANSGHGDPLDFLLYALQGFVSGLREQIQTIGGIQQRLAWEQFVDGEFQRHPLSKAMHRRRKVALILGRMGVTTHKRAIPDLSPKLARIYATISSKTLARDMHWLVKQELLVKGENGYRARTEVLRAFRPERD